MTTTTSINPAEVAAKTLLAVKPFSEITVRDFGRIWDQTGVTMMDLWAELERLEPRS